MKVRLLKKTDPTWIAASVIEKQSKDGCFSPNEIADYLNIYKRLAVDRVDVLYDRGLTTRIDDDWSGPVSGNERWCLIQLSLTVDKEYEVLAIWGDDYLILDDPKTDSEPYGNDPVIFHKSSFEVTDPTEPTFWKCQIDEDGERNCCLPSWDTAGFFEDYHDGVNEIKKQFWKDLEKYFPETWKERTEQSTARER